MALSAQVLLSLFVLKVSHVFVDAMGAHFWVNKRPRIVIWGLALIVMDLPVISVCSGLVDLKI